MTRFIRPWWAVVMAVLMIGLSANVQGEESPSTADLTPVTMHAAPAHEPVVLVRAGRPEATIVVAGVVDGVVLEELVTAIELTTGARLPVARGAAALAKVEGPAIVLGDCAEAAAAGLKGAAMPVDGFAIKTAANRVFIVGNDEVVQPASAGARGKGTTWGVVDFLERFVGVRWYFPPELGGRSVVERADLVIAPVHLSDAPAFTKREIWPPMADSYRGGGQQLGQLHTLLRHNNAHPITLVVHAPQGAMLEAFAQGDEEIYQMRSDGTRDHSMLCYGDPRTLERYLEEMDRYFNKGQTPNIGVKGNAVTVSPGDAAIACYCEDCRRLWDDQGGALGTASRVLADFTRRLAEASLKRFPQATIVYLPYMNYTLAPEGIKFPGNVEVQLCGMPGLAMYKEPGVWQSEQANIDAWIAISGRPIQNWHYSCWPEDRTSAVYQYPHTIQKHYQANRDKTVGTFINGVTDHWPRQHLSLYVWMKCLWNPDINVDAVIDTYCRRMYGPAAGAVRELVKLEIDGWENTRWDRGLMSPKSIYEVSYPEEVRERMQALLARIREEAGSDQELLARVDYLERPFAAFFKEAEVFTSGTAAALLAKKVGENPKVDGKLDDAVWQTAEPATFALPTRDNQRVQPKFPTELRAVWTAQGVTFGFRLTEPAPDQLVRKIRSQDDSMAWWDDNVELFLDPANARDGSYYQLIINPNGAVSDNQSGDETWNADPERVKIGVHEGEGFWSLEVFFPYEALPGAVRPATGVSWYGQFTRHRLADSQSNPAHPREYTRLNFNFGGPSRNLSDFTDIRFVE